MMMKQGLQRMLLLKMLMKQDLQRVPLLKTVPVAGQAAMPKDALFAPWPRAAALYGSLG